MRQLKLAGSVVVVALVVFLLNGCMVTKDSPAPGCRETIGFVPLGGCFGKTAILDLMVEPEIACLKIRVNNCNGGVIEVQNTCDETLVLGGVEISPAGSMGLDVVEGEEGEYSLRVSDGNFSDYVPEVDTRVKVVGRLGGQEISIAFTKTAQLCEL